MVIFSVLIYIGRLVNDIDNINIIIIEIKYVYTFIKTITEEIIELYFYSASYKPADSFCQTSYIIGISIRLQKIKMAVKKIFIIINQTIR